MAQLWPIGQDYRARWAALKPIRDRSSRVTQGLDQWHWDLQALNDINDLSWNHPFKLLKNTKYATAVDEEDDDDDDDDDDDEGRDNAACLCPELIPSCGS